MGDGERPDWGRPVDRPAVGQRLAASTPADELETGPQAVRSNIARAVPGVPARGDGGGGGKFIHSDRKTEGGGVFTRGWGEGSCVKVELVVLGFPS